MTSCNLATRGGHEIFFLETKGLNLRGDCLEKADSLLLHGIFIKTTKIFTMLFIFFSNFNLF